MLAALREAAIWPVAEMTAARRGGRFLGNTRRRGDAAPADQGVNLPHASNWPRWRPVSKQVLPCQSPSSMAQIDPKPTSTDSHPSCGKGRIVGHSGHYEPVENGDRDRISVVEGVHDDDEIEFWHNEKTLAAVAEAGDPS
jgi:hypothetical protein